MKTEEILKALMEHDFFRSIKDMKLSDSIEDKALKNIQDIFNELIPDDNCISIEAFNSVCKRMQDEVTDDDNIDEL